MKISIVDVFVSMMINVRKGNVLIVEASFIVKIININVLNDVTIIRMCKRLLIHNNTGHLRECLPMNYAIYERCIL